MNGQRQPVQDFVVPQADDIVGPGGGHGCSVGAESSVKTFATSASSTAKSSANSGYASRLPGGMTGHESDGARSLGNLLSKATVILDTPNYLHSHSLPKLAVPPPRAATTAAHPPAPPVAPPRAACHDHETTLRALCQESRVRRSGAVRWKRPTQGEPRANSAGPDVRVPPQPQGQMTTSCGGEKTRRVRRCRRYPPKWAVHGSTVLVEGDDDDRSNLFVRQTWRIIGRFIRHPMCSPW